MDKNYDGIFVQKFLQILFYLFILRKSINLPGINIKLKNCDSLLYTVSSYLFIFVTLFAFHHLFTGERSHDGKRHGRGKYYYPDGSTFDGLNLLFQNYDKKYFSFRF